MRINDLGNTATDFASDDYIALDGATNGSRKMKNDILLKVTAQKTLAGNVAPAFDPTRTSENPYKAWESVSYEGEVYTFKVNHYGAWNASDVEKTDVSAYFPLAVSASSQFQYGFVSYFGFNLGGGVGSSVNGYRVYNASVKSIEIPCGENDIFVLYGVGGNTYRLYAFVNSSREILSVATINNDASSGLRLVAPQGAASLIVNLVGDGKVYKLSDDSADNANTKAVNNIALLSKVSLKNVIAYGYIKTNGDPGSDVNLTPVSQPQYVHQIINVQRGERYFIYGACGDIARLWCFVDSENKVVARYVGDNAGTLNEIEIDAPCDGKLIVNFKVSNDYDILGLDASKASNDILKTAEDVKNNVYAYGKKSTYNGYIATNVGIGNVVSYNVVYGNYYTNAVFDCEKGDSFAIKGAGGATARLWCFVDSENKVVSVADASVSTGFSVLYLTAPSSGKFIFNSVKSVDYFVSKKEPLKDVVVPELDFLTTKTLTKENLIDFAIAHRGYVSTNVGSGNVVSYDVTYVTNFTYVIRTCKKDDTFFIRGTGGSVGRLWCFVDSEDKVVDSAYENATANGLKLIAPCDGKFIFNSYIETNVGTPYCKVWGNTDDILSEKFEEVDSALSELDNRVIEYDGIPYDDITDYSSDITAKWMTTMMDIVYAKFDTLISEAPSLITKYDAAELVDMAYPRYANGISAGDPDYLETPPYKTYIYKISNINANVGNTGKWAKKKIFITGSIHGAENLGGFNLFALASHILRKPSKDLFAMLAKFDIWLIPFVNGYGVYHTSRTNANGIDINRNFGTAGWTISGTLGEDTYSGQNPDSEFETQLVEALKNYIKPDFYVDHHCTPHYGPSQIYSFTFNEKIWRTSYMALVDLSNSLINAYPEYFGTKYHLFKDELLTGTLPTSPAYPGYDIGKAPTWFHEQGIAACCIEIYSYINYLNGVVSEQVPFGDDVHIVNEMSLRCQLDYYLRAVMG